MVTVRMFVAERRSFKHCVGPSRRLENLQSTEPGHLSRVASPSSNAIIYLLLYCLRWRDADWCCCGWLRRPPSVAASEDEGLAEDEGLTHNSSIASVKDTLDAIAVATILDGCTHP